MFDNTQLMIGDYTKKVEVDDDAFIKGCPFDGFVTFGGAQVLTQVKEWIGIVVSVACLLLALYFSLT